MITVTLPSFCPVLYSVYSSCSRCGYNAWFPLLFAVQLIYIYCGSEIGNLSMPGKYKSIKEGRQNLAKYGTSSSYWICSGTYSQKSYPLYSKQQKEDIICVIYQMQYISSLTIFLSMMHYSSLYGAGKDLCLFHTRIHKECIYDKHSQKNKKIPQIYPSDLQEVCPQILNLGLYKRTQLRRRNGDL